MQDFRLIDRVVVVTQAAQANGPAICEALGRQGAKIVLGDARSANPVSEALNLSRRGIDAFGVEADLAQVNQIENLLMQAVQSYGRIDIMVNNTVVSDPHPADELPVDTFMHTVSVNLKSVFFGCQLAARHMLDQKPLQAEPSTSKGVIINIASVGGVVAIPGQAAFCAAMAGMIAMTKVLAAEWGPRGLRVVAVGTGLTESLIKKYRPADQPDYSIQNYIPLGVSTPPEAIGRAVVYLASNDADYTTGTTLYTDGGWLAYGYL